MPKMRSQSYSIYCSTQNNSLSKQAIRQPTELLSNKSGSENVIKYLDTSTSFNDEASTLLHKIKKSETSFVSD